jgi:hypothetical protein
VAKETLNMEVDSDESPIKGKDKSTTTGREKRKEKINKGDKGNEEMMEVDPKIIMPGRKKVTIAPEPEKAPVKAKPPVNLNTFFLSKDI